MELSDVYVDFRLNVEEGTSIFNAQVLCSIYTEQLDQAINIGEVSLYLFYLTKENYLDICAAANSISTDLYSVLERLPDICDINCIQGLVATCHGLKLKGVFWDNGIGPIFLEKMMSQLSQLTVKLILLLPDYFMAHSSLKNITNQDVRMYCRFLGFQELQVEGQLPVMYRYLDKRLAAIKRFR